jgi:hypothetical protein
MLAPERTARGVVTGQRRTIVTTAPGILRARSQRGPVSDYRRLVRFDFMLRDVAGNVLVTLEPNADPAALGTRSSARGFPVCTAAVTYDARGYLAALGWIQLVRSTDGESAGAEFEIDPFEPLGPTAHPFCWFGLTPTLFDAPSRPSVPDTLEWIAHSFLGFIGGERQVCTILGFSWGFSVCDREIVITPVKRLSADDWDRRRPVLRRGHPLWNFAPGFQDR